MSQGPQTSGQRFRHYQVLGKLGSGGMGVVYRALDTRLNRHVALKFLPENIAADEEARSAFLREARAASALDHPNIGTIHGIEETEEGRPFIVMAYYEGRNLAQRLNAEPPLPMPEIIDIATQVARGLAAAHSHQIVHRDIKPANILLTTERAVKIVDFGIARVVESTQATQTMAISGTAAYMSPEQAQGKRVDHRSDLWSFGIVLYEMAAGRCAFEGVSLPAILYAIVHYTPETLPSSVPMPFQQVIYKALAKQPEQRYQTAAEMLADLEALAGADAQSVTARQLRTARDRAAAPPVQARAGKHRRVIVATAAVVAASAVLALSPAIRNKVSSWTSPQQAPHIAVLPFDGGGAENAALADGLMESLTSRLSNLQVGRQSLWVVPATEVRRRKVTDPAGAVKTFNANLVVNGTFHREGDVVRLTVNLIDPKDMRQLPGSGEYEDRTGDFSGLQNRAVAKLANALNINVTSDMLKNTGGSVVPAAYQSYLTALGDIQRFDRPGSLDQAISLLESAATADPKFALAYSGLAEAYLTRFGLTKDKAWLDKAAANCTHALELNDTLAPVHVTMGRIHNGAGHEDLAVSEFERAQQLEPANADALAGLAQVLEKQKRLREAEDMFHKAAVLRPDFWDGYSKLGNFYLRQKRWSDAERQFQKIIDLTPDNYIGYQNRGAALIEAGRLPEAATMLQKAARLSPSYGTYANLGQVHYRQKQYSEAAKSTEEALKLNDKDFRLWTNLAGMYRFMGRDADAIAVYRRVVPMVEQAAKARPQDAELQAQLAELYAYTGNGTKAAARIETALALSPDDPSVLARCADASDAAGKRDQAVEFVKRAIARGLAVDDLRSDPEARGILSDARLLSLTSNLKH